MSKLFVGNWKMYLSDDAAEQLAQAYLDIGDAACEVCIAPSSTVINRVASIVRQSKVALVAQNAFWADSGAYTGEVSPAMLASAGVRYVILGHSERREYLYETDEMIAKKAVGAIAAGLVPIVCVGETKEDVDAGLREDVIRRQISAVIDVVPEAAAKGLIVAYEPRWAIGTGVACAPEEAVNIHELIKSIAPVRVLYGGSVDASNIKSYTSLDAIDGVLVGGASTKADQVKLMLATFS